MMVLRLLVMLLKCVDIRRQQDELDTIHCSGTSTLKDKLFSAIAAGSYHAAKFDNVARDLLNIYNMNLAENVLVYSFRCKTLKFGVSYKFYKTWGAEHFWIDLNYCPRTLTFKGRFKQKSHSKFTSVTVGLQVCKMTLKNRTLIVRFTVPAQFSKKLNHIAELKSVTHAELELPAEEALRLQENEFVVEYYNSNRNNVQQESLKIVAASDKSSESDKENELPMSDQLQGTSESESTESQQNNLNQALSPIHHFKNSYNFLIGHSSSSGNISQQNNNNVLSQPVNTADSQTLPTSNINFEFKLPSLSNYEKALQKETSIVQDHTNPDLNSGFKEPSLPQYEKALCKTKPATSKKRISRVKIRKINSSLLAYNRNADESPKSSRQSTDVKEIARKIHPIRELRVKRRFFKNRKYTSDSDQTSIDQPQNVWKKRNSSRKTKAKRISNSPPPPKRKQINKVKPMSHVTEATNCAAISRPQEVPANRGIVNITSFLDDGNESAAIFNEDQCRTILQHVQRINEDPSAVIDNSNENQIKSNDVYEDHNVSDAEPGQSYRNFRTRRQNVATVQKKKRCRKSLNKSKMTLNTKSAIEFIDSDEPSTSAAAAIAREIRKRSRCITVMSKDSFNNEKDEGPPISKSPCLSNRNKTIYSADIEIDLTTSPKYMPPQSPQLKVLHLSSNLENKHFQHSNNIVISLLDSETDSKEAVKTVTSDSLNNHGDTLSLMENNKVSTVVAGDIQGCRQNIENAIELTPIKTKGLQSEFRDVFSPEPLDMMDISDNTPDQQISAEQHNRVEIFLDTELSGRNQTNCNQNTIQFQPENEKMEVSKDMSSNNNEHVFDMAVNECILYRERSEYGSDSSNSETEYNSDNGESDAVQLKQITYTTPKKVVAAENIATTTTITNCQVTTATSIFTRSTRVVSKELFITSPQKDDFRKIMPGEYISKSQLTDFKNSTRNPMSVIPKTFKQESSNLIDTYKLNISKRLSNLHQQRREQHSDIFFRKVSDVSERIIEEIEKQERELHELEANIARIVHQLESQYESFQNKSVQFKCLKGKLDTLFKALADMNIKEEIEKEFVGLMEQLQKSSKEMCTEQWRNFVKETTENLVRNITNLADL